MYLNILFLFFVSCGFFILIRSRHPLSPASFVFAILVLTSIGYLFDEYSFVTSFSLFSLLIFSLLYLFIEKKNYVKSYVPARDKTVRITKAESNRIVRACWWLSVFPVLALLYFVQQAGGLVEYASYVSLRVSNWKGQGVAVALLKSIAVFNLIYYFVLLVMEEHKRRAWVWYGLHFSLFVTIAFASGSRNTLLVNICLMLLGRFMLGIKLPKMRLGFVVSVLFIVLLILGALRNSGSYDDGIVNINGVLDGVKGSQTLSYTISPIEIYSTSSLNMPELHYGKTYLSLVTNFVPRSIWPGKWETSGVVFTKEYLGNRWSGYSFLSPGLVVESFMNFGVLGGAFFVCIYITTIFYFNLKWFLKIVSWRALDSRKLFYLIAYMYFAYSSTNMVFAEFTTNYFNMILRLIFLYMVYIFGSLKIGKREKF